LSIVDQNWEVIMPAFDRCEFLFDRWKNLAMWRNLWTILIFVLGVSFTIFLIGAVFLFIRSSWLPAALSTLGTIVDGMAVGWILARRNQSVAEENEAKKDLIDNCGPPVVAATAGGAAQIGTSSIAMAVEEIENRLTLLYLFR
jgi:hypothetical protein